MPGFVPGSGFMAALGPSSKWVVQWLPGRSRSGRQLKQKEE
jgi:hypothetical protein